MAVINWQKAVDPLESAKADKIQELDTKCSETILGNFAHEVSGVTYYFGNNALAQGNFDKLLNAFNGNMIQSINWTAYDESGNIVRLAFDATNYMDLYKAHLGHIQSNISKFRDDLQPKVEAITVQNGDVQSAIDAVNAIIW